MAGCEWECLQPVLHRLNVFRDELELREHGLQQLYHENILLKDELQGCLQEQELRVAQAACQARLEAKAALQEQRLWFNQQLSEARRHAAVAEQHAQQQARQARELALQLQQAHEHNQRLEHNLAELQRQLAAMQVAGGTTVPGAGVAGGSAAVAVACRNAGHADAQQAAQSDACRSPVTGTGQPPELFSATDFVPETLLPVWAGPRGAIMPQQQGQCTAAAAVQQTAERRQPEVQHAAVEEKQQQVQQQMQQVQKQPAVEEQHQGAQQADMQLQRQQPDAQASRGEQQQQQRQQQQQQHELELQQRLNKQQLDLQPQPADRQQQRESYPVCSKQQQQQQQQLQQRISEQPQQQRVGQDPEQPKQLPQEQQGVAQQQQEQQHRDRCKGRKQQEPPEAYQQPEAQQCGDNQQEEQLNEEQQHQQHSKQRKEQHERQQQLQQQQQQRKEQHGQKQKQQKLGQQQLEQQVPSSARPQLDKAGRGRSPLSTERQCDKADRRQLPQQPSEHRHLGQATQDVPQGGASPLAKALGLWNARMVEGCTGRLQDGLNLWRQEPDTVVGTGNWTRTTPDAASAGADTVGNTAGGAGGTGRMVFGMPGSAPCGTGSAAQRQDGASSEDLTQPSTTCDLGVDAGGGEEQDVGQGNGQEGGSGEHQSRDQRAVNGRKPCGSGGDGGDGGIGGKGLGNRGKAGRGQDTGDGGGSEVGFKSTTALGGHHGDIAVAAVALLGRPALGTTAVTVCDAAPACSPSIAVAATTSAAVVMAAATAATASAAVADPGQATTAAAALMVHGQSVACTHVVPAAPPPKGIAQRCPAQDPHAIDCAVGNHAHTDGKPPDDKPQTKEKMGASGNLARQPWSSSRRSPPACVEGGADNFAEVVCDAGKVGKRSRREKEARDKNQARPEGEGSRKKRHRQHRSDGEGDVSQKRSSKDLGESARPRKHESGSKDAEDNLLDKVRSRSGGSQGGLDAQELEAHIRPATAEADDRQIERENERLDAVEGMAKRRGNRQPNLDGTAAGYEQSANQQSEPQQQPQQQQQQRQQDAWQGAQGWDEGVAWQTKGDRLEQGRTVAPGVLQPSAQEVWVQAAVLQRPKLDLPQQQHKPPQPPRQQQQPQKQQQQQQQQQDDGVDLGTVAPKAHRDHLKPGRQQRQQLQTHYEQLDAVGLGPMPPPPRRQRSLPPVASGLENPSKTGAASLGDGCARQISAVAPAPEPAPKCTLVLAIGIRAGAEPGLPAPSAVGPSAVVPVAPVPLQGSTSWHAAGPSTAPGAASGSAGRTYQPSSAAAAAAGIVEATGQVLPAAGYKFVEVVRKKDAREALPGHDCVECQRFYGAMRSWGAGGAEGMPQPACGHVLAKGAALAGGGNQQPVADQTATAAQPQAGHFGGLRPGPGLNPGANPGLNADQLRQDVSRHRARYKRPQTQEGFWDMGFMDSLDSRVHLLGSPTGMTAGACLVGGAAKEALDF